MESRISSTQSSPVRRAIDALVERGVLGFTPGYGMVASVFHMALPRRVVAVMARAAAEDDAPPF